MCVHEQYVILLIYGETAVTDVIHVHFTHGPWPCYGSCTVQIKEVAPLKLTAIFLLMVNL